MQFEVSAKENRNIDELFHKLGLSLLKNHVEEENRRLKLSNPKKKKGCCKS